MTVWRAQGQKNSGHTTLRGQETTFADLGKWKVWVWGLVETDWHLKKNVVNELARPEHNFIASSPVFARRGSSFSTSPLWVTPHTAPDQEKFLVTGLQWPANVTSLQQPLNKRTNRAGFCFNMLSPLLVATLGGNAKVHHTNRVSASLRNI